jgi:c-di-GMP-binding flagellar brake protein YcgR
MDQALRDERRQFARVSFTNPVRVEPIAQSPAHIFHPLSANLSEGGLRVLCPECMPVDSLVLLDLDTQDEPDPVRAIGRVAWARRVPHEDRWHVGLQFVELTDVARSHLRGIVNRLHIPPR